MALATLITASRSGIELVRIIAPLIANKRKQRNMQAIQAEGRRLREIVRRYHSNHRISGRRRYRWEREISAAIKDGDGVFQPALLKLKLI